MPATTNPWPPDASELRRVAEHADGLRDQELILVLRPAASDGTPRLEIVRPEEKQPGDKVLFGVATPSVRPDRGKPVSVLLQTRHGDTPLEIRDEYDALFWSEPAVEKFFFPYYKKVLRRDVFAKLEKDYYEGDEQGNTIVAFGHIHPTIYTPFVGEDALLVCAGPADDVAEVRYLSDWHQANFPEYSLEDA